MRLWAGARCTPPLELELSLLCLCPNPRLMRSSQPALPVRQSACSRVSSSRAVPPATGARAHHARPPLRRRLQLPEPTPLRDDAVLAADRRRHGLRPRPARAQALPDGAAHLAQRAAGGYAPLHTRTKHKAPSTRAQSHAFLQTRTRFPSSGGPDPDPDPPPISHSLTPCLSPPMMRARAVHVAAQLHLPAAAAAAVLAADVRPDRRQHDGRRLRHRRRPRRRHAGEHAPLEH